MYQSTIPNPYLRFANIYYVEKNCDYTQNSVGGQLPYLVDEQYIIHGPDVISYLSANVMMWFWS